MLHPPNAERGASEKWVIAKLLASKHAIAYCVAHKIKARCFLSREYREVFTAIETLYAQGAPYWDYDAVKDRCASEPWYVGDEWLGSMAILGGGVDDEELEYHTLRLASYHAAETSRTILMGAIQRLAENDKDPIAQVEMLRDVSAHIMALTASEAGYVYHNTDLSRIANESMERLLANPNPLESDFELTGFKALDRLAPFPKGRVCVVAGRPSHGKTIMATEIALRCAARFRQENQGHVLFFSSEMNAREMANRIVYNLAQVSREAIMDKEQRSVAVLELRRAHKALARLPLILDTHESPDTKYIMSRVMEVSADKPVRLIVWDYVEYTGERQDNKVRAIEEATKGCHAIAKRFDVPFVLLSQLSREADKNSDGAPSSSHLSWSDSLFKIPAVVLMLQHPWMSHHQINSQTPNPHDENEYWVYVKKNTHGGIGPIKLMLNRQTVSIREATYAPAIVHASEEMPF